MESKKTLCKYCKNSKVIERFYKDYCWWLEYDCIYKSHEYEYEPDRVECCNYLKMSILDKIIRFIRIFWFNII